MKQNPKLKDFRVFLYYIWKHLNLPDPTPIQYDIARYLVEGPKRKLIEAFRGIGKSWITSAYVLYRLYWNPQLKILVVSASKERADSFSTFTLRLINEIPWLAHLKPDITRGQRNSKISFDVGPAKPDHSPSVKSIGIFGQLTGSRADIIIADDIEVANNSYTQSMRDKISEAVKEFDAILKPDAGTEITYLGTPQTEMSLYNNLGERGYSSRIWPARIPDAKRKSWYGDRLAPMIDEQTAVGKTTDPNRFTDRDLMEREASYGRSGFALQYMLDTSLSDKERYPLRCTDLSVMSLNPDLAPERVIWAAAPDSKIKDLTSLGFSGDAYYAPMGIQGDWRPYDRSIMFVDPAGRGADETSWAIMKSQGVNIYLFSAGGHRNGYDDLGMEQLYAAAQQHAVQKIVIESNFGDGMFTNMLRAYITRRNTERKKQNQPELLCSIEEVRNTRQKELRIIDTAEPILNQHRLIVDRKVIEQD
ncbi:MAG: phage terminase large subunit, partial [Cloacibacillus sp.]